MTEKDIIIDKYPDIEKVGEYEWGDSEVEIYETNQHRISFYRDEIAYMGDKQ